MTGFHSALIDENHHEGGGSVASKVWHMNFLHQTLDFAAALLGLTDTTVRQCSELTFPDSFSAVHMVCSKVQLTFHEPESFDCHACRVPLVLRKTALTLHVYQ